MRQVYINGKLQETGAASTGIIGGGKITEYGGLARQMINKTGAASVKGTLVEPGGSVEDSFTLEGAAGLDPIGAVLESGIADGDLCYVVVAGAAEVLLEDSSASTWGYWVKTSETQAGRVDASNAAPVGGTIQGLQDHMQEVGHCLRSVTAGTDKLTLVNLHFN